MSRSRSTSPSSPVSVQEEELQSDKSIVFDNVDDTGNLQENDNEVHKESDALIIEDIPAFWNVAKINKIIQNITKTRSIIDGIKNLTMLVLLETPDKGKMRGCCLVKFHNANICKLAYEEWKTERQSGKFSISINLDNLWKRYRKQKRIFEYNLKQKFIQPEDQPVAKRKKLYCNNMQMTNKYETYGLSHEFLTSLNVKVPLYSGVYVTFLPPNTSEAKVREVFGLAGNIVYVSVSSTENLGIKQTCAKILYDHPVEAVQAISMFDKQKLYSFAMKVKMDVKQGIEMPDGLSGIGPGLGPNGVPLRGVRNRIELEPLKHLLKRDDLAEHDKHFATKNTTKSTMSPFIQPETSVFTPMASPSMSFQAPMVAQIPMATAPIQAQIPVPVQAPNQQSINPFGAPSSMMNPFNMPLQSLQMLQSFSQQNPASLQQAIDTLLQNKMNTNNTSQISNASGNTSSEWQTRPSMGMRNDTNSSAMENYNNPLISFNQNSDNVDRNYKDSSKYVDSRESRKSSRDEEKSSNDKSDMLLFKNLPRSVTLQALKNKMQEVGQLKFAEMTGQGRAIVAFFKSKDTERCIKLFDRSKVDGQIVDVRYI